MRSLPSHASLGAAVMLALLLRWPTADAQPAPATHAHISASQQAKARKLTNDAIAAESDKNYTTAIALYEQAYQIVPHPILQFNIGQVYMLVGNLSEAEKYFRRYLTRDPNGPGAPIAREFLASLPATASSPPQTGSPSQPDSPASSGKQTATKTSEAAPAPEHKPLAAGPMRGAAAGLDMRPPEQIEVAPIASDLEDDEVHETSDVTYAQEKRKYATKTLYIGYALIGTGALIGSLAFVPSDNEFKFGLGFAGVVVALSGVGTSWHAHSQLSAARAVAWSPVIGSGFAGVALAGSLP